MKSRHSTTFILGVVLACLASFAGGARCAGGIRTDARRCIMNHPNEISPLPELLTAAEVDTYNIVWFDFEMQDWQGWTRVDNTAQTDTFFRVDTLLLTFGDRGMWCGRAAPPPCGDPWPGGAGYGNAWRQSLVSDTFPFAGTLTVTFTANFDSEPDHDATRLQYESANGDWIDAASFDADDGAGMHVITLKTALTETRLRFLFTSDRSGSDEDGMHDSNGGCAIGGVRVEDSQGIVDDEDFETSAIGARSADGDGNGIHWRAVPGESFGLHSGFADPLNDLDPCHDNLGSQIVFFIDSPDPSIHYPGLFDTPSCTGSGADLLCQDERGVSPVIGMTRYSSGNNEIQDAEIPPSLRDDLGGAFLHFTVYRDLPLQNLVFYTWRIRTIDPATGCPDPWIDRGILYYGPDGDYLHARHEIGDLVTADSIQVALSCIDLSGQWYRHRATSVVHTPAPWFDNVRIQRFESTGPQWHYRSVDLFQDNFPSEPDDMESVIRADAAIDVAPPDDPGIRPGDSVVVRCTSPNGGGIGDFCGGPNVFMHVRCEYIGDPGNPKPPFSGVTLEGDFGRFISFSGEWTVIQADTARVNGAAVPDYYGFDLNDSLFTRGYRIDYYFSASDNDRKNSTLPAGAKNGDYFEWTCLPTLVSDILFVDDYDGRGSRNGIVQEYYDPAFLAVLPADNQPDRYDVNAPSALASNGPGSRARFTHLTAAYDKIIWDCGDLASGTISDGTPDSDKSNDAGLLLDWLTRSEHDAGLWISGDNVAYDLAVHMRSERARFLLDWCGVQLDADGYFEETGGCSGGVVSPLVKGVSGSIFHDGVHPDSFVAFGGCPIVNRFDVLNAAAAGAAALTYPDFGGAQMTAGVQSIRYNHNDFKAGTVWLGFSFMYVRNVTMQAPPAGTRIASAVIDWFDNLTFEEVTGHETPGANVLHQNFPNPFNPATTIRFALRRGGPVALRIYDAAGRLVRTLVDDTLGPGSHAAQWDGRSDRGSRAASGVYFYRIRSAGFEQTRKMVLLR